jgi:pyrroloquinoline quinone (PQQ) biosynthesis protein C
MITLLLKILHKQRSNDYHDLLNHFSLGRATSDQSFSRIGDSYHFLSNILHLSSQMSEQCRVHITQEIEKIKTEHQQRQPVATKASDLTVEQK